jgi:hypothetical protein
MAPGAGLGLQDRFGWYNRTPFDRQSRRHVSVYGKASRALKPRAAGPQGHLAQGSRSPPLTEREQPRVLGLPLGWPPLLWRLVWLPVHRGGPDPRDLHRLATGVTAPLVHPTWSDAIRHLGPPLRGRTRPPTSTLGRGRGRVQGRMAHHLNRGGLPAVPWPANGCSIPARPVDPDGLRRSPAMADPRPGARRHPAGRSVQPERRREPWREWWPTAGNSRARADAR